MCLIDDVLSYTWMFPEEKVCNFTSKILQWFKFKHKTLRFPRTWSTCMYLVSCGLLYFTTLIQEFASPVPVDSTSNYQVHTASTVLDPGTGTTVQ